ncbi:hypothetical protein GCM10007301_32160 [Azorhizobium oxalatiphilum]|uniref:Uncharacterized protein n=1 Tax=Azorhizobium oxalatiphilum TaxID=980631 RepID=A0A917FEG0_9HYPH|nr:hypothetical protein GCM10007301_32160 [Azorhizobium oxalatiphilum]
MARRLQLRGQPRLWRAPEEQAAPDSLLAPAAADTAPENLDSLTLTEQIKDVKELYKDILIS